MVSLSSTSTRRRSAIVRLASLGSAAGLAASFLFVAPFARGQIVARQRPVAAATLNPATIVIPPLPPDVATFRARLSPKMSPAVRAWVTAEAKTIGTQNLRPEAMLFMAKSDAGVRFGGQNLGAADIDALVILVMAVVASDAEADLRQVLAGAKAATMSEAQQLRMQMAMDRQSKLMSTLSNLLKKASESSGAIIQNIK